MAYNYDDIIICPNCNTNKNVYTTLIGTLNLIKQLDPNTATCYTCGWKSNVGDYYKQEAIIKTNLWKLIDSISIIKPDQIGILHDKARFANYLANNNFNGIVVHRKNQYNATIQFQTLIFHPNNVDCSHEFKDTLFYEDVKDIDLLILSNKMESFLSPLPNIPPKNEIWNIINAMTIKPDRLIKCSDGDYMAYYFSLTNKSKYACITCGEPDEDGITTCFSLSEKDKPLNIIHCQVEYMSCLSNIEKQIIDFLK